MAGFHKVAGGGKPDRLKPDADFYPTPPLVTRAILRRETFPGTVWEPAAGAGHMVDAVIAYGQPDVVGTDIIPRRGDVTYKDFLAEGLLAEDAVPPPGVRSIITNPPFRHAERFVRRAISLFDHGVERAAFLLRFQFVESDGRNAFLTTNPPARVWVFSGRVQVSEMGLENPRGGMIVYAWWVWERDHDKLPGGGFEVRLIDTKRET